MSSPELQGVEPAKSRLRATIAAMEKEIVTLPGKGSGLRTSFNDLVAQLGLGPEPEVRVCPVCQHVGMRAATICGHCWTKLAPLAAPEVRRAVQGEG